MTNEEIKAVYEYMGWEDVAYWWCEKCQEELGGHHVTYQETCCICNYPVIWKEVTHHLDSNSAWECVQEMERKGDWVSFTYLARDCWYDENDDTEERISDFDVWLYNPTNFFSCFGKYLVERRKK